MSSALSSSLWGKSISKGQRGLLLLLLSGLFLCFVLTFRQSLLEALSGAPSLADIDSEFLVLLPLSPLH